uniref:Abraxas 1, BRCA1 A complex subunit n=1 Tax=Cyprinodon variegatus TaxID=28743 RepID=A0A3Q2EHA1_CYPVA
GVMSEPNVRISGTVLASLMFQHVNSDSDVVRKFFLTCHRRANGTAAFDVQDSVVGWYRQRRNSEQHMTFREKLVHEKLKAVLQNPHMIFFLLTSSRVTQTDSTHRMEYSAFTSCSSVPVLVTNLGLLEQQGYWKASVPCSASGYSLTMKKHRYRFSSISHPTPVLVLLLNLLPSVEESERSVKELQLEVSALRRRLRARQQGSAGGGAEEQQSLAGGKTRRRRLQLSGLRRPSSLAVFTGDAQPRRNQLLLEAVRALLGSAPLFLTQTLDLQAVPVPDKTASPQNAEDTEQEESRGKRQREELQGRGRKRRRSSSPS